MKLILTGIVIFLFLFSVSAQPIPVDDYKVIKQAPFISPVFNRIFNSSGLDSFYKKIAALKKTNTGTVTIVHIGDSHIQADFLTGLVRKNFQDFFGNAGRGLVFPYQLAKSNAPPDVASSSNTGWQYNRLAHPEIPIASGISGYCILSAVTGASIDLSLKNLSGDASFNRLKFFLDSNSSSSWLLHTDSISTPVLINNSTEGDIYKEIMLEQYTTSFSLHSLPSEGQKSFYGVSLENCRPGIIYHTIGVNGAAYESYNISSLFWQQLPALKADMFIVSLGTNEAQKPVFDNRVFRDQVQIFLEKLNTASPGAVVLITTAPDSYIRRRRSNPVLRSLNVSLYEYCNQNNIPVWDLYRMCNGYGAAYNWVRRGYMNNDRIHYTPDGYRIQGQLLFNALAKGYNTYINRR